MFQIVSTMMAVLCATALFQTATLVIGGHIAKDALSFFYEMFPEWWQRMLIVIVPLPGIGNLLAAYAFQNPVVAGVSFLVSGLWAPLITASLIHNKSYTLTDLLIVVVITTLALILAYRLT